MCRIVSTINVNDYKNKNVMFDGDQCAMFEDVFEKLVTLEILLINIISKSFILSHISLRLKIPI